MPMVRGHHSFDGQFTQIPNMWIRDSRLSYKARGLLAELLSHREGFHVSRERLARSGQDGDRAVRSAIDELEAFGYLKRSQSRTGGNRFGAAIWVTTDPHEANSPSVHFAPADIAPADNEGAKNTRSKKTREKKDLVQPAVERGFEVFWSMYPRRVAKAAALKAFAKAWGDYGEKIIAGVERYATDPNLPPKQFIPHPATWLNEGRWDDEPLPPRVKSKEEQAIDELALARKRRERDMERSRQISEENAEARRNAAPPPVCKHGLTLLRCIKCINEMNNGIGEMHD